MPLPIGFDKTISQPFMVALMTDLLDPQPPDRVLEVGTGLGYQTAILARLVAQVWSVEIVEEFVESAQNRLKHVGVENVSTRVGDGSRGWAEHAPFDKIVVAAAAKEVPKALLEQLKPGGRLVIPLGAAEDQRLSVVSKSADSANEVRAIMPVRFSELET
jgi:protein-L-isoaspartate(D-aspartate) O-methyltransferase